MKQRLMSPVGRTPGEQDESAKTVDEKPEGRRWSLSPPGIRLQLTVWYTIVSAVLMLIFGLAFYTLLQQFLATSFDSTLQQRSQQVAEGISVRNGHLVISGIVDQLPELDATAALIDSFSSKSTGTATPVSTVAPNSGKQIHTPAIHYGKMLFVRVLDTQGHVVYSTSLFNTVNIPLESVTQPLKGIPWHGTIENASDDQLIRIYSTMLVGKSSIVGVVQVGQSLTSLQETSENILLGLLIVTPFILALSACGSYWLAGRAFVPIHRLTRTARQISATDLHQRVPVPLARDEVQDLSIIFNQMIARLERSFVQQRRFVADASHELRTPVAVIRNMTEIALAQPSSPEDYIAVLREVNAESERLGKLIGDMLALARADEGQIHLDSEPVRLDLLSSDVVESLEPLAVERKISLRVQKLAPVTVLGDMARLIQVIMSLVDNALTYTNAGGRVTLSVEKLNGFACLTVSDTGIGIAQKDIAHIFERFYRADPARSKAVGGTGLGLSIVDWVVRAHNGTVTVKSQPGRGSSFIVQLPLAEHAQAPESDV